MKWYQEPLYCTLCGKEVGTNDPPHDCDYSPSQFFFDQMTQAAAKKVNDQVMQFQGKKFELTTIDEFPGPDWEAAGYTW